MPYVYVYLDPRKPGIFEYGDYKFDYEPFYVGKGKEDRDTQHLRDLFHLGGRKNTCKDNKLKAIIQQGKAPIILRLIENLTDDEACAKEIEMIALIGRSCEKTGPLTNLHKGGTGGSQPEEIRKQTGLKISQRWAEGAYKNKVETPMTDEQKEKIRQAHLGMKEDPEITKKRVAARAGYKHSEETKQHIREGQKVELAKRNTKQSWENPEIRKKRLEGIKDSWEKKKGIKRLWINNGEQSGCYEEQNAKKLLEQGWIKGRLPVFSLLQGRIPSEKTKQKMRETAAQPEKKAKRIENSKKNWESEEYRKQRLQTLQETCATRTLRKKVWIHTAEETIMVYQDELDNYLNEGYQEGRGESLKKRGRQGKSYWVNNGTESKMLREDKALELLEQDWVKGRLSIKKDKKWAH